MYQAIGVLYVQASVRSGHVIATVYRYKFTTCNCESEDEESDNETETEDDKAASKDEIHEPSIRFMSIHTSDRPLMCFHLVTEIGILQKSAPVFASGTSILLWP